MIVLMRPIRYLMIGTSLLVFLLAACKPPKVVPVATPTVDTTSTLVPTQTPEPTPKPELGQAENPIPHPNT
jgi:hypothetical protein